MGSTRRRGKPPPLDPDGLERLALAYVGRFQTTRARLARHLRARLQARGWAGDTPPDVAALVDRLAARGLIDEEAYAQAKARTMAARGLGARRIRKRLRADGLEPPAWPSPLEARAQALAFARRRGLGPFGPPIADRRARARQLAAMVRAGHPPDVARAVLGFDPEESDPLD